MLQPKIYFGSYQVALEVDVEGGSLVWLAAHFDATAKRFDLRLYKIESKSFSFDMEMKSFIKAEYVLFVFPEINTQSVVHYCKANKLFFVSGLDCDIGSAFRVAVFDGIADQVVEYALNIRCDGINLVSFTEVVDDFCSRIFNLLFQDSLCPGK